MARTLHVISYDVSDNKRRRKLALILEGIGERVQKSVFEAFISGGHLRKVLAECLKYVSVDAGDSLRIYSVCRSCVEQFVNIGGPARNWEQDVIID